jgi:serine/threonine-protein kinase
MMGVVYEAQDPALGRRIALKTIELAFAVSAQERQAFEQRFFTEARISARLSHPGIVAVHDVGRDAETGTLFIALEYLPGRTLADITREGPLEWRAALRITAQVAEALHHAHSKGVIHRDVKPANVMLLPSGVPKVMDFGIAKIETARLKHTSDGQFFGTPLYMSPEQALGETVGPRSDLFSLGAVAYALLTGRQAFAAENVPSMIRRVVQEDPAPPSSLVPGLPKGVDEVVGRMLAKAPSERYPDGRTLAEDIEDVLDGRSRRHYQESALAALLEEPTPRLGTGAPRPSPPTPVLTLARTPATPPTHSPSSARQPGARFSTTLALVGLGGLGIALVAALVIPYATQDSEEPAETLSVVPLSSPGPAPAVAEAVPAHPPSPARIIIDFEHHLRSGTLRIWLDRELLLDERLDGTVHKELVGIKLRKGGLEKLLEVAAGKHDVRVQVVWDDSDKSETITGAFEPGSARRLEIRVGRLRKNLSMDWK